MKLLIFYSREVGFVARLKRPWLDSFTVGYITSYTKNASSRVWLRSPTEEVQRPLARFTPQLPKEEEGRSIHNFKHWAEKLAESTQNFE